MAKKNSPTEPPDTAAMPDLLPCTGEGPLLVVGRVLRRTRRDVTQKDSEILTLVTYEIQALSGEIVRVTQAGVQDCLVPGSVAVIPVYVSAYLGKAGPAWSLRRKQATGMEF